MISTGFVLLFCSLLKIYAKARFFRLPNIDNTSNKPYNKVVRFEAVGLGTVFWPNTPKRITGG